MEVFSHGWALPLAQVAGFWVSLLGFRGDQPGRFLLGLAVGAVLARLGWFLLHLPVLSAELHLFSVGEPGPSAEELAWLLGPGAGLSVLLVPLGPLALTPWSLGSQARLDYWVAACRTLAPGLAVARFGCVLAGCCSGAPLGGDGGPVPPTALYEWMGWVLASGALAFASPSRVPGLFLLVFGGLRLATEPWRVPPPLGEPALDPGWLALAWMGAGIWALWDGSMGGTLQARQGNGSNLKAESTRRGRAPEDCGMPLE